MPAPPRLVLDTNVCLDLFVFGDPRVAALHAALRTGEVAAVTREDCRAEWPRVLRNSPFRFDEATCVRHEAAFDAHVACLPESESITHSGIRLPRCADPDDQKFLELALQAGAAALITRDNALLALAKRMRRDGLFAILAPEAWTDSYAAAP
ncbi:MAG TPA: PIN domain-containing protein [Dokdonella sp.]